MKLEPKNKNKAESAKTNNIIINKTNNPILLFNNLTREQIWVWACLNNILVKNQTTLYWVSQLTCHLNTIK